MARRAVFSIFSAWAWAGPQAGTDWIVYGRPGASLVNHFVQNAGPILASCFARIGLRSIAMSIYRFAMALQDQEVGIHPPIPTGERMSAYFYIANLPTMLAWPAIAGLVLGLIRWIANRGWGVGLVAGTFLLNVLAMSNKGSRTPAWPRPPPRSPLRLRLDRLSPRGAGAVPPVLVIAVFALDSALAP
jgi:hypothetical protein